ncbi:MAG: winged helix DNA-binding domain-containing protein [Geodermatophilaceae bacterium]|nr:winged helix DNA-binding domain-containing protein [Geodermatophilaceae bacterium]
MPQPSYGGGWPHSDCPDRPSRPRSSWHFVAREDVRWLPRLTKLRVHQLNRRYHVKFGLDGPRIARGTDVVAGALADGPLIRAELTPHLERAGLGRRREGSGTPTRTRSSRWTRRRRTSSRCTTSRASAIASCGWLLRTTDRRPTPSTPRFAASASTWTGPLPS